MIKKLTNSFQKRWSAKSGYKEILAVAFPLIISTGSWSVQHFVDRMFLTWYSPATIAAAMPAGMLNFTIVSLFMGITTYINTFVAQYYGSKENKNIGPIVWQGLYISLFAGISSILILLFSESFFLMLGHADDVVKNEIIYFKVLSFGVFPVVATTTLSSFFTGRGKTSVIMWINIQATAINIILDYFLIFGHSIFPEMGILGAGLASILSQYISLLIYIVLMVNKKANKKYNLLSGWRFNLPLFKRLIRFGLPNGIQFSTEMAAFTAFIFIVGSLGTINLAATNIVFNISTLAFMPMIGLGISVSIFVGQNIGKGDPDSAEYSVYSAFHITVVYMFIIVGLYLFLPSLFLSPFAAQADPKVFKEISEIAMNLIKFIAIFSLFDTVNILFSAGIKGAGDTKFVMIAIILTSICILVIPAYLLIFIFKKGIYYAWGTASIHIMILGIIFYLRFKSGKWKSMSVIRKV